eukprot:CAMPEP_0194288804 /NCGR_PEP_ID=MMETSP0169-20130528/37639_1 /TAXON_ID=218684 /ORGANISM="Corethron pennatum, Strain L29A3" /LENGTH=854 /DNA_ID=CAMNT_0039035905 /DNA_START=58 /DNA_END=2622 /DNA_ORIENTATION=+
MVRVFIKGGIWKNSEDEVLKAAVMKYGKQQWARVASLLNRKSAKQCKARWYEWLDPSIKKIEWSRDEEEKLLHLAKLLPGQWRTVGQVMGGRTAGQCQERYERLLDAAAAEQEGGAATGPDGTAAGEASSGARKLRPGEIDPHPETRPARPDPVDMDEDEVEMLQEARARLANTRGKKAKRKEREKLLAEARRLADLQKRRELKAAGLLSGGARRRARGGKQKGREIDYGVEIPFHKPAPAGFHDVNDERHAGEALRRSRLKDINYGKINEDNRRSRDAEAAAARKRDEARIRALEKTNMAMVVAEVSRRSDPIGQRKRGAMELPAPAVDDDELEALAKMDRDGMPPPPVKKGRVTDVLLGEYTGRAELPTPRRGVAVGESRREAILAEASALRAASEMETPLLGGETVVVSYGGELGISSATPGVAAFSNATPGGLASLPPPRKGVGATPSATPLATPLATPRDVLGLNRPGSTPLLPAAANATPLGVARDDASLASFRSAREQARAIRKDAKRAREELREALAALPAPLYEYELAAPAGPAGSEMKDEQVHAGTAAIERDAADLEEEERQQLARAAADEYERRSSVVKRKELPRPVGAVKANALALVKDDKAEKKFLAAENMICEEALRLLNYDAHAHPVAVPEKRKSKKRKGNDGGDATPALTEEMVLDHIEPLALDAARTELDAEYEKLVAEHPIDHQAIAAACATTADQMVYTGSWTKVGDTAEQRLHALRTERATVIAATDVIRKRANKMEKKLGIQTAGLIKKANEKIGEIGEAHASLLDARVEAAVYKELLEGERMAVARRIKTWEAELLTMKNAEGAVQNEYAELEREQGALLAVRKMEKREESD